MTLNGAVTVILHFSLDSVALRKCSPNNLVFSDISFMAIFTEVTENERITYRHLCGIHPLLDYDASESQSMISI